MLCLQHNNKCLCRQHIEGAVRFNLEEIRDKSAALPRAIPEVEQFNEQVGNVSCNTVVGIGTAPPTCGRQKAKL